MDKTNDTSVCVYEEIQRVFDIFPKYLSKILLGEFNAEVGWEHIFKRTIGNKSLHEISDDNGVRVFNFVTSKNMNVKSMMLPHRNVHKYIWTASEGKKENKTKRR
jgi:hypothetical protein